MSKRFITNWVKAIEYFFYAYLISMFFALVFWVAIGLDFVRWIFMILLMPPLLYTFSRKYFQTETTPAKEYRRLALFWMALLIFLDLLVFVLVARYSFVRVFIYSQPFPVLLYAAAYFAPCLPELQKKRQKKEESWTGV